MCRDGGRVGGPAQAGLLRGPLGLVTLPPPRPHGTRRGSEGPLSSWTPGLGKAQGDMWLRAPPLAPGPPPQALVVHEAGCGLAHSPSGRAGAGCPQEGTAPEGRSGQGPGRPSPPHPCLGGTHPAVCGPAGLLQLQALGPWPWAPAQTHTATHGTGRLPTQLLAPRVVVDGVPQCLRVCRDPPPGLASAGATPAARGPQD